MNKLEALETQFRHAGILLLDEMLALLAEQSPEMNAEVCSAVERGDRLSLSLTPHAGRYVTSLDSFAPDGAKARIWALAHGEGSEN